MWDDLREIVLDDSAAAAGTSGASHVARRTHGAAARATSHEHGDHGFDSDTHETGLEDEEADEEHDGAENELAPVSYKELPYTHANKLPFIGLVQMLDRIVEQSGPKKKTEFLFNHKFVGQASLREYLKNQSWWPIMRLVLPDIDKERLQYRLQHKNLGKAFISALGWDADKNLNPQAQRLIHYNNPTVAAKVPGARVGDLSTVLEDVLRERCPTSQRGVTVGEVNQFLDRLRDAAASPARLLIKAQADILCEMLRVFDAHQLGWISRIILKEMRSGLKHESVLRSYHPDAQEAFNMHGDLRRLLAELPDASVRHAFHVKLFDPCRPMLSKHPLRLDEVTNGLGDFAIETKLDGERCLVHFDKSEAPPKVKIFSRNAKDVTAIYGRGRNLTLLLAALPALTSGVVDGEMLAFDSTLGDAVKFGSNKTAAKEFLDQETSVRWPLYMAFDLLVADGELLTGQPYVKRRERLERAFRACPNHVELQPFVLVTEADLEVRFKRTMAALDAVMQDNKEGLVLKSAASPYVPGEAGRAKGFWVKVKPDYVNGLSTDLDCVVLGGYLALGRRRLAAGETPDPASFLLGLAKDPELPDGRPSHFYQFAKVGSGYDTATLAKLRDALRPHMQLTAVTPPPHFSPVFAKKDDVPNVWFPPESSVIVQVTAHALVSCDAAVFDSGMTLRFPRVTAVRYDKNWYECARFSDVDKLRKDAPGGLHGLARASDVSRAQSRLPSRKLAVAHHVSKTAKVIHAPAHAADLSRVDVVSEELRGRRFFVFPGTYVWPAGETTSETAVCELIKRHGGELNLGTHAQLDVLVAAGFADPASAKLSNVYKAGQRDVFNLEYVCDLARGYDGPPKFSHHVFIGKPSRDALGFGDHVFQDANYDLLMQSLDRVSSQSSSQERAQALAEVQADPLMFVGGDGDEANVLAGTRLFFARPRHPDSELTAALAGLYGAEVQDSIGPPQPPPTHVVVPDDVPASDEAVALARAAVAAWRVAAARSPAGGFKDPRFVRVQWLLQVIASKQFWAHVDPVLV